MANVKVLAKNACTAAGRFLLPRGGMEPVDRMLLRWAALCSIVLCTTALMLMGGAFSAAGEWQVTVLLGRPFFMEAQDVQVSLLAPGATFGICTALTLYLALVLMRLDFAGRTQVCFLAAVAVALPGLIGTLWHGVLYVAPFLCCVALLWGLTLLPLFRTPGHA